jgi:putative ABC transport system ATP-binding protein
MLLRIERVSKSFERGGQVRRAVHEVSLELHRGQMIGVFGASGSGKTTLLRIAAGLESPDSGFVSYRGTRLDEMGTAEHRRHRRREIGCVWARQQWPAGLGVLEHVALPLLIDRRDHRSAARRAREMLVACEAEGCVGAEPDSLSDGERQRVEIARALVAEPRLLIADGAVSSLSLIEQEAITLLLATLAREAKLAILIADSGAGAVLGADPIFYLRDGRLLGADPRMRLGETVHHSSAARGRDGDA